MANRNFHFTQALEHHMKIIAGNVTLGSDASVGDLVGRGYSVSKSGTGEYTITLQDAFNAILAFNVTFESATLGYACKIKSADAATKTYIVETLNAAGSPADVNAAAKIHFSLMLRNSSVS